MSFAPIATPSMCIKTLKAKSDPLALRAVQAHDIAPLTKLWHDGWQLGHADYAPTDLTALRTLQSFEDRIRDSIENCYISGPIGAPNAFARIIDDDLDQFYVDPSAVGQGLGKRLMVAVEAHFVAKDILNPHLYCAEQNDRAVGFYTAMGWVHCGVSDVAFETSAGPYKVPVIRFEKKLIP